MVGDICMASSPLVLDVRNPIGKFIIDPAPSSGEKRDMREAQELKASHVKTGCGGNNDRASGSRQSRRSVDTNASLNR